MPPRGLSLESLVKILPIANKLEAITITDNPIASLRASSIAYGYIASDVLGIEVIPNITCRDKNLLALQSDFLGGVLLGHKNFYVITGDSPKDKENFKGVWEVNSIDLCKVLKKYKTGKINIRGKEIELTDKIDTNIGGAIIFGRSSELNTYYKKVDAGFDYFITQITYDSEQVVKFFSDAENTGNPINKHIQIGISPAETLKKFHSISKMSGIKIPDKISHRLENSTDFRYDLHSILLELTDDLKADLNNYSIGFHVMPIGSDIMGTLLVEDLSCK